MKIIFTRTSRDGKDLIVAVDSGRIVVTFDDAPLMPNCQPAGHIAPLDRLPTVIADKLRVAGRTHLLQGNVGLTEAEAKAVERAKAQAEADARAQLEALIPGLGEYEVAQRRYDEAQDAYDRAVEHGYPPHEARSLRTAERDLDEIHTAFPATRAWRSILAFCGANNDVKSAAGRKARCAVEAGENPCVALATMQAEWSAYIAERAVD